MKEQFRKSAMHRVVSYKEIKANVLSFETLDEAIKCLKVGDSVFVYHNCFEYLMKVDEICDNKIICSDDVSVVFVKKATHIEKVLENYSL